MYSITLYSMNLGSRIFEKDIFVAAEYAVSWINLLNVIMQISITEINHVTQTFINLYFEMEYDEVVRVYIDSLKQKRRKKKNPSNSEFAARCN